MADISQIKPSERDVEILDPNGRPIGLAITFMSIDDDRMKAIKRQINDRALHLERRGKGFDTEDIETNLVAIAFKATTGWTWHDDEDGEPGSFGGEQLEFNRKNFATIMNVPWIEDQITKAISETKAFFKPSKPT